MTRNGKVARLPREIREQLNRRLEDGEPGTRLVEWLNGLPEVREIINRDFGGLPLREQNLSEWKQGGYREWLAHQDALDYVRTMSADADELKCQSAEPFTEKLSVWLATRYAAALAEWDGDQDSRIGRKLRALRSLAQDVMELRRGDLSAARLKLEREKLDSERKFTKQEQDQAFWERAFAPEVRNKILAREAEQNEQLRCVRRAVFGCAVLDEPLGSSREAAGKSGGTSETSSGHNGGEDADSPTKSD